MLLLKRVDEILGQFEREFAVHNRIEVSRLAILHNLGLFERLSGKQVIPVLKANAYGHGIRQVAEALKGKKLPYIAVDGYFEALRVRQVSRQPVLIMGAIKSENFKRLKYDNFAFVVGDRATIDALGRTGKKVNVHLECNTGMNRYGATVDEAAELAKLIQTNKNLTLEGVMSHLADADGEDPKTVFDAVEGFDKCVEMVRAIGANPTLLHIAQTAGSVSAKSKYANAMRLGIGLYGINPFDKTHKLHAKLKDLRPALRLVSTITRINHLKKGDKVSYAYEFTASKDMDIAVLPIGYYEGAWTVARGARLKTGVVKIGQKFTPIVGRVCMNHTMISLDGINAKVGDEVVIYSNDPKDPNAIDTIAAEHGLFNYTLLTSLSIDVRRVLVQ